MSETVGHFPVMLNEVLELAGELRASCGDSLDFLDGTFGRGGHSRALVREFSPLRLLVMDRDPDAVGEAEAMRRECGELSTEMLIYPYTFDRMKDFLSESLLPGVHLILLDLGVSTPQLFDAARGFSFQEAGPLDMRMDNRSGDTAADLLARLDEKDLADLIFKYGEEPASRKIAREIVSRRKLTPIRDTLTLADLIATLIPRRGKIHPATKTFQALRLAVNRELELLERALSVVPDCLQPGGRLLVISFHSLEDRMVKDSCRRWEREGLGKNITRKVITPSNNEIRHNKASRSAKLRCFEKARA